MLLLPCAESSSGFRLIQSEASVLQWPKRLACSAVSLPQLPDLIPYPFLLVHSYSHTGLFILQAGQRTCLRGVLPGMFFPRCLLTLSFRMSSLIYIGEAISDTVLNTTPFPYFLSLVRSLSCHLPSVHKIFCFIFCFYFSLTHSHSLLPCSPH